MLLLLLSCLLKHSSCGDFSGGPGIKNLPSSAGDVGSIPDRGTRILRAMGQPEKPAHRYEDKAQPHTHKKDET